MYCFLQDHPFPAPAWIPRRTCCPSVSSASKTSPAGALASCARLSPRIPAGRAGMNTPATLSAPPSGKHAPIRRAATQGSGDRSRRVPASPDARRRAMARPHAVVVDPLPEGEPGRTFAATQDDALPAPGQRRPDRSVLKIIAYTWLKERRTNDDLTTLQPEPQGFELIRRPVKRMASPG